MSTTDHPSEQDHVYRTDKFIVPPAARAEFLQMVRQTHEVLRKQQGFVRDLILEQRSGPGAFNVVTIAEWESEAVVHDVRAAVAAYHASIGFDPAEMMEQLGITADIGIYSAAKI
ncbi:MAG TPA: antibiotic biosynthesis monooxygenase [Mesorhizobium sp.]|jgi:heme-degrading monooxygenase HmoA|nr:antibiotic biosynthesis monooxygenase [Mesorhizobium sp.]